MSEIWRKKGETKGRREENMQIPGERTRKNVRKGKKGRVEWMDGGNYTKRGSEGRAEESK